MHLWKQWIVPILNLSLKLNQLEMEHWDIHQVIPIDTTRMMVLARQSSTSYEVGKAIEEGIERAEPDWVKDARALVLDGKRIEAIKLVRKATGLGLKESKDFVDENYGF